MNILFHSNAPWAATGYGQQTGLFTRLLKEAGHNPGVSAFWGLHSHALHWEGLPVYPGGYDAYGNDILLRHAHHHFGGNLDNGIVVTLVDIWVLAPAVLSQVNCACWTPVDHKPAPPEVIRTVEASGGKPLAMTRFGEHELRAAGLHPVYVPHGIDTDLYRPRDRQEARKELGLPEQAFVVGMVAANKGYPPRKGFPEAVAAFSRFMRDHDDAFLVLHTEPEGRVNGINMHHLLANHGIPPEKVSLSNPTDQLVPYPPETMAAMFSAFDVLLNPAYGEGFGIPIAEAAACGTPAITTDWTAMPEVGDVGWTVGGQEQWTPQQSWWRVPDIGQLVWALGEAHTMGHRLRDAARQHALQYDHRTVFADHMLPALESMQPVQVDLEPEPEPEPVEVAA